MSGRADDANLDLELRNEPHSLRPLVGRRITDAMTWPAFDLGETINLTLGVTGTMVGVFLGAKFAGRQLRDERRLDRRVETLERLIVALEIHDRRVREAMHVINTKGPRSEEARQATRMLKRGLGRLALRFRVGRLTLRIGDGEDWVWGPERIRAARR